MFLTYAQNSVLVGISRNNLPHIIRVYYFVGLLFVNSSKASVLGSFVERCDIFIPIPPLDPLDPAYFFLHNG